MEGLYELNTQEKMTVLNADPVFMRVFQQDPSLSQADIDVAKVKFQELYPDDDFEEFRVQATRNTNENDDQLAEQRCNTLRTFDPRRNAYLNINVMAPKQKKDDSFNIIDFLRQCENRGEVTRLNMDLDVQHYRNEDKNSEMMADSSLRKLAKFVLIYNRTNSEPLLLVQAENRVQ